MTGRARRRWLIAGGTLLTLVVAGAVVLFVFRDRATPANPDEVAATLVTGAGRPGDFGLYEYATTGYETTDALGGSRHDYPGRTYLTIQPGGCGTLVRWEALQQRWDEWDYCPDGSLAGRRNYHEWFTIGNLEVWTCSPPIPGSGEPGDTWEGACTRAQGTNVEAGEDSTAYEVLGYETLAVGDEEVETLHLRTTAAGVGGSDSTDTTDIWVLPGTLLPVRQVAVGSSVSQSRIGPVRYYEEYEIQLVSLYPSG